MKVVIKFFRKNWQLIFIISLFLWIRIPFIRLPLHNDELSQMTGVERIVNNNFSPFVEWWGYHPPLIFELVAIGTRISSNWILVSRLTVALFGMLTLLATYILGSTLYNKQVGFISTILLFFLPIFQAQSSLFNLAVPFTFFFLLTLLLYKKEKWSGYILSASLLILTKETGALVILLLSIFDLIVQFNRRIKKVIKRLVVINIPQLIFVFWVILNKIHLGWYIWPFFTSFLGEGKPYRSVNSFKEILKVNFVDVGIWILFIGILTGLLVLAYKKSFKKNIFNKEIIFSIFLAITICIFFYFTIYLPRYTLFTLPPLIIVLGAVIYEMQKANKVTGIVMFAIVISVFFLNWFHLTNKKITWAGEKNFGFVNIIHNHQETIQWIQNNSITSQIATHYPLDAALTWSLAGYVSEEEEREITKLETESLENFKGVLVVSSFFWRNEDSRAKIENNKRAKLINIIRNPGVDTKIYYYK